MHILISQFYRNSTLSGGNWCGVLYHITKMGTDYKYVTYSIATSFLLPNITSLGRLVRQNLDPPAQRRSYPASPSNFNPNRNSGMKSQYFPMNLKTLLVMMQESKAKLMKHCHQHFRNTLD